MYRIAKTLNHNSFIGVEEGNNREYLVMGKGIAFGKKTGQRVQPGDDTRIYSLTEMTERGNARTIVQGVSPLSLELASAVLDEAEKEFGKLTVPSSFQWQIIWILLSGGFRTVSRSAIRSPTISV